MSERKRVTAVKPCKHNEWVDCLSTCYCCSGCGWTAYEDKYRKARIDRGLGLVKKDGLYCLVLGRKK